MNFGHFVKVAVMTINGRCRFRWFETVVLGLLLLIPAHVLYARGGAWLGMGLATREGLGGYHPPAGVPGYGVFGGGWGYGGRGGWGISHHSLDAPRLVPGFSTGGAYHENRQLPAIDRSVEFPGSSSNTSTLLPSFQHDIPSRPYQTEKKFDPPYFHNYNGYWHHGYWGGGQWGWGRWGGPAGIWSVGRWWLGPIYFTSGYGEYRNPFAVEHNPAPPKYLNYAQPLENIDDDELPGTNTSAEKKSDKPALAAGDQSLEEIQNYLIKTPEVKAGLKSFDAASESFQQGQYDEALKQIDAALEKLPYDPALHEFRALVLFANKDYQQAAATVYAVLSVSPGWDWTTLSGLYADQDVFTGQLRDLETYHKQHANSAAAAFLRGYHYTTCRHTEAAVKQFENAVKLLPDDRFLPQLLALIAGGLEKPHFSPAGGVQEAATNDASNPTNSPTANRTLVGNWRAEPRDSTTITLRLGNDQQFVWTATHRGSPRIIAGRYAVGEDSMLLAGGSGTLVGRVQIQPDGAGLEFYLPDNPNSDPGLNFRRISGQ